MPVMRNEDGVFGTVKHVAFPHALSGYLPYTIQHIPPEERPAPSFEMALQSPGMRINDLISQLVLYAREEWTGEITLESLGEYLVELGSSQPDAFIKYVQDAAQKTRRNILHFAETQREAFPQAPAFWSGAVQTYMDSLYVPSDTFAPADLNGSFQDRWSLFRDLITQYGALLTKWAVLFETAHFLNQKRNK